jgi:hypothetical protein
VLLLAFVAVVFGVVFLVMKLTSKKPQPDAQNNPDEPGDRDNTV